MKVWGIDVSKDYIIAYDGKKFYKLKLGQWDKFNSLLNTGDVIVLEQTGIYAIPWLLNLRTSVDVFIGHTTALKRLRDFVGASKDDVRDAELLRKLYFEGKHIYPFNLNKFFLRWNFFNYRRAVREATLFTNRLRAFVSLVDPSLSGFKVSGKGLKQLEEKLRRSVYTPVVRAELDKLRRTLDEEKIFKNELSKLVKAHPDYEILKTFPGFSDVVIAGLVSTYWDVNNFKPSKVKTFSKDGKVRIKKVKPVDRFVAYVIGKIARKQSGKKDTIKKESKRPYILGLFYPIYVQSGKKNHPLHPLWEYLKEKYPDLSGNQRYIKFLDKLLRLVFLAVKNGWSFEEVVKHKAETTLDPSLKSVYTQILERVRGE